MFLSRGWIWPQALPAGGHHLIVLDDVLHDGEAPNHLEEVGQQTRPPSVGARTLLGAPGLTTSNKKLLGTSASLLVTSALLVVTRSY